MEIARPRAPGKRTVVQPDLLEAAVADLVKRLAVAERELALLKEAVHALSPQAP